MRTLQARVDALEATVATRPARRRRECAPRPADGVVDGREKLWSRLVLLNVQYGHGRLTRLRFVIKYHLGDPSDFCRFLSTADKRGIAEGSVPAGRYYQALREAIAELEALRDTHGYRSHGNMTHSQFSAARPQ